MENKKWIEYCLSMKPKVVERFKQLMKKDCNIENPKTLTEKIQWLKIHSSSFLKTYCSDKITVRNYCKEKLGKDYFIPIIGIYDNFSEIDFSKLPDNYVLKTNHGSHTNIIVKNKKIDVNRAKHNFEKWLSKDWTWWGYEMAYKLIPRKIFIEQYMNDGHADLIDYKFLCFNGEPKFCQVISDRHGKNKHLNYYDMNFTQCKDISRKDFPANYNIVDEKPINFDEMKIISKKLSEDFDFVRVDFYEINGQIYLSELTFYPGAGYFNYEDDLTDLKLGNYLTLKNHNLS